MFACDWVHICVFRGKGLIKKEKGLQKSEVTEGLGTDDRCFFSGYTVHEPRAMTETNT